MKNIDILISLLARTQTLEQEVDAMCKLLGLAHNIKGQPYPLSSKIRILQHELRKYNVLNEEVK